ncbi:MAG: hypothetical protein V4524_02485 [Patescibacteria group bacterium]
MKSILLLVLAINGVGIVRSEEIDLVGTINLFGERQAIFSTTNGQFTIGLGYTVNHVTLVKVDSTEVVIDDQGVIKKLRISSLPATQPVVAPPVPASAPVVFSVEGTPTEFEWQILMADGPPTE